MPGRLQLLGVLLGTRGASAVPAAGCLSELRVSSLWGLQAGERPESGFGVDIYVPPSGCCTVWGGVTGVRFGISALSPRRHRFRPPCRPWQSPAHGGVWRRCPVCAGWSLRPAIGLGGGG